MMRLLFAAVLAAAVLPAPAAAHGVVVDGVTSEWMLRVPPFANMGLIARDALRQGEYVFEDAAGDYRTDVGSGADPDLTRVRITGNATVLALLVDLGIGPVGAFPVQVQITIDTDRVVASGATFLAGFADTSVTTSAAWEFLVQTRFAQSPPGLGARVLDASFAEVGEVAAVRNVSTGEIEMAVPWSALGLAGPPSAPLRLTVTSFLSVNTQDDTVEIGGPSVSNALDALGDCGDPRQAVFPNAWDCDLSDGVVDWFVDVSFAADGEVYAPVLITRYLANASSGNSEWVALRNVSPLTQSLAGLKLGDEEQPDPTTNVERLAALPGSPLLSAGETFVVASDASQYLARYGVNPAAEFVNASPTVPDLATFAPWFDMPAAGSFALANVGDHVLLLDASNTVLDVVNYGTGTFTGVIASAAPAPDQLFARMPAGRDTDDNSADFRVAAEDLLFADGFEE